MEDTISNIHTEIYVQIVFAVKSRQSLIPEKHREELHKFITGIVKKRAQIMLAVFCMRMPDHAHVFVGLNSFVSVSALTRDIKAGSSKFINDKGWLKEKFNWQSGYGAFSYSTSDIDHVAAHIANQEEHHRKQTFRDEFIGLLNENEIPYNEKHLFEWPD
jgi:putative transposase